MRGGGHGGGPVLRPRELTGDRENEQVAAWISDSPVPGTSELVLHAPAGPWMGESVEVIVDQGYIATAVGEGDREVLSQVAFRSEDLVDMEPGTVYINDTNPDVRELVGRNAEDFTADVCSRGQLRADPPGKTSGSRPHIGMDAPPDSSSRSGNLRRISRTAPRPPAVEARLRLAGGSLCEMGVLTSRRT